MGKRHLLFVFIFFSTVFALEKNTLSAKDFRQAIQASNSQIIDVRTEGEYRQGHIKGAKLYDLYKNELQQAAVEMDKNKPVYLYCRSGNRSTYALNFFLKQGFTEAYHLSGGIISWYQAGLPIYQALASEE